MGARINPNYAKLAAGYLFPEIGRRVEVFQKQHPEARIIRLGIGDTTLPLTPTVVKAMHEEVDRLGNMATYKGYGAEQGNKPLREAIAEEYSRRGVKLDTNEIFVSDGAKPDVANLQTLFREDAVVAVQDPAYPVYVDTNVSAGRTGDFDEKMGQYDKLVYMPCTPENGFFPKLPRERAGLIYLCSPNNPTGAVATKGQLKEFVDFARGNRSVILFDAAYSPFISDAELPRSIYEIDGARECAIEIHSFSKIAGFTGVRLGWSVVPSDLVSEDSKPGQLNRMWNRRQTTFFNGASNIAQAGGLAVLTEQGMVESLGLIDYYMENAKLEREGLQRKGLVVYGGVNAPYVWMQTPGKMDSWKFFDKLLGEAHVVGTPGSGFGPSGKGYFRLSAFGSHENVRQGIRNIEERLQL